MKLDVIITTRKEQFIYLLKTRLFDIILSSIFLFIFYLPLFAFNIFSSNIDFENNFINISITYILMIPLIIIFGLGISGILYSFKRMCFNEGANIAKDIFYGIKLNYKDFLKLYLFYSIFYALYHIFLSLLHNIDIDINFKSVIEGLFILIHIFFIIIFMFMQNQMIYYNNTFLQSLKNSIKFFIGKIFKNLIIFLIVLLPYYIYEFSYLIPNQNIANIIVYISLGFCFIFYFGFSLLLSLIYSLDIFDNYINKKYYPNLFHKGLHKIKNETINE